MCNTLPSERGVIRPWHVLACALATTMCAAGPFLPKKLTSGEVRSLAGLRAIELKVAVGGRGKLQMDDWREAAQRKLTRILTDESDLQVVANRDHPILHLLVATNVNAQYPELISYAVHLSVEQRILVQRTSEEVFAPTYGLVNVGFTARAQLKDALDELLPDMTRHFLTRVQAAQAGQ